MLVITLRCWVDLGMSVCSSDCLYTRELIAQFLRYQSENLHTFFPQEAALEANELVLYNWSI